MALAELRCGHVRTVYLHFGSGTINASIRGILEGYSKSIGTISFFVIAILIFII